MLAACSGLRCAIATLPTQADALAHAAQVSGQHHALPALEHAVTQAGLLEVSRDPSQQSYSQSYSSCSQEASQEACRVDPQEAAAGGGACATPGFRDL